MKKTVNFRFATGTLEKLEKLAEGSTRTAVLERLIDEAFGPSQESLAGKFIREVPVPGWKK